MRLGLYINKDKKNLDSALKMVFDIFSAASDKIVFLNAFDYVKNNFASKYESVADNKDYDVLVAIGGDGTIMSAIRSQYHLNKPVIGLHVGYLGFLAESDLDNCHEVLTQIKNIRISWIKCMPTPKLTLLFGGLVVTKCYVFADLAGDRRGRS